MQKNTGSGFFLGLNGETNLKNAIFYITPFVIPLLAIARIAILCVLSYNNSVLWQLDGFEAAYSDRHCPKEEDK